MEAPQKQLMKGDLGLVLKSKAKHAAISAKLDKPFVFSDKPLIVQYEVTMQVCRQFEINFQLSKFKIYIHTHKY